MKLKAAIFDMDGLLIDSEPLWQEAEKKVFGTVGISLTTAMCVQTMGMRLDEVVKYWYSRQPWKGPSLAEVQRDVLAEVKQLILGKGEGMRGVSHILDFFDQRNIQMAVASSSYLHLIEAVLEKLKIRNRFKVVHSAEFELKGKPDPGIYISTAHSLGVEPAECIAFEDSYNGLLSAKQAGMRTVAVPDQHSFEEKKLLIADLKIRTLDEFNEAMLSALFPA
jgi:beta-phosphoglucomutase-like phosphatase (HAD superfamily)